MANNLHFGNKFTGRWCSFKWGALIENKIIEKLIKNVCWRFYAGGPLKEVANSAGLTILIGNILAQ